jgi:hypothetical protein
MCEVTVAPNSVKFKVRKGVNLLGMTTLPGVEGKADREGRTFSDRAFRGDGASVGFYQAFADG